MHHLDYRPSRYVLKILSTYILFLALSSVLVNQMKGITFYLVGSGIVLSTAYYSYKELSNRLNVNIINYIKGKLKKWKN